MVMAPIAAIKAVTPLTRAAKIQYSITDLPRSSFLSPGDVPQIRVIAFLIQLEEPFRRP